MRCLRLLRPSLDFRAASLFALFAFLIPGTLRAAMPTEDYPVVKLQTLDKITARTGSFEAKVGSTVKFGPLYIKVQACRKSSPIDLPESAAFLQVWEIVRDTDTIAANALAAGAQAGKPQWVFSGWMFASSPALSAMDHPVYDVWVIDCLQDQNALKAKDELKEGEIESKPVETPEQKGEVTAPSAVAAPPAEQEPIPEEEPPPGSPDIQRDELQGSPEAR